MTIGARLVFTALATFSLSSTVLAETFYIAPSQVDLIEILPPPPAPGSPDEQRDLAAVLDAQKARTQVDSMEAVDDNTKSVFRFADVLGIDFAEANLPLATSLFKRVSVDRNDAIAPAKRHFNRARPYLLSAEIKPILAHPATASYPSDHSTFAYVDAILLATMVPEKKEAIFKRANTFANHRIVAGVHFPTDVEAGRISGSVIANALLNEPRFQIDFAMAKAEVRQQLKLQ